MCGIFGYVGKPPRKRRDEFVDFLERLAVLTSERGRHATGFVAYYAATERSAACHEFHRAPGPAREYVRGARWRSLVRNLPDALVGHCRYSTGSDPRRVENNHPFVGDRYGIVHNGVVRNVDEIVDAYDLFDADWESETDSEVILHLMEAVGPFEDAAEEVLYSAEGRVAVAALDVENGDVCLFTNGESPLVGVYVRRWRCLVYASTSSILIRALSASTVPAFHFDRSNVTSLPAPGWVRRVASDVVDFDPFRVHVFNPVTVSEDSFLGAVA